MKGIESQLHQHPPSLLRELSPNYLPYGKICGQSKELMNSYKKSRFLFNASRSTPVGLGYRPLIVLLTKFV